MSVIEWGTAKAIAQAGRFAWVNRRLIQNLWIKSLASINQGRTDIVVTGHSSAGKSVLVGQMLGAARDMYFEEPGESLRVEVGAVTIGGWSKLIRVLPGQIGRRTKGEIEAFQKNPSLEGVIHLTDFGFVHPRDAVTARSKVEQFGLNTIEELRQANLEMELHGLRDVLHSIRTARGQQAGPKWLIIAVNKVDLYQTRLDEALYHYHPDGTGGFGKVLKEFQAQMGIDFSIHVVQTCARVVEFSWNNQSIIPTMTGVKQDEVLRNFVSTLASAIESHRE